MPKNKTINGLTVLFSSAVISGLLWGCSSDDAEDESTWTSTDDIYSTSSITSSKASIGANGDVVIVWQEQETEVRDDNVTAEGIAAASADHSINYDDFNGEPHSHKILYTKTNIMRKQYDASSGNWSADTLLKAGFWEKTKAGKLADADGTDTSKVVYDQNLDNVFIGDLSVSMNTSGDAVVGWIQLGESAVTIGDASKVHNLFVYVYNSTSNSWSTPALSTDTVTSKVTVQNKLDVSLNDSNVAHLVWLGRDELSLKVNAYQNIFDGTNWSTSVMLSDGNATVRDIKLVSRNATSGVAIWSQYETKAVAADSETCDQINFNATPLNLYGNWFNATAWYTVPEKISDGTGDIKDFDLASNKNGAVWASWAQTSNANYPCGTGLSSYRVTDVSTVNVSQLSGDIDTDLSLGAWSVAENIQPDIVATTVDESTLDSADTSIAVDASGNAVVAWVEVGDAEVKPADRKDSIIRANAYSNTGGSWLSESFIVSDTESFASTQPIEKTIPNDHVAPKVVSTASNQFTISWQYWSVSPTASGFQIFSSDYDASGNALSNFKTVSKSVSPVVNQMDMFSVGDGVQMFWSQEVNSNIRLKKSVK